MRRGGGVTDDLILKGDLVDLHLVDSGRLGGGAKDCVKCGQYVWRQ